MTERLAEDLPAVADIAEFTEAWSWLNKFEKIGVLSELRKGRPVHQEVPKIGGLFSSQLPQVRV